MGFTAFTPSYGVVLRVPLLAGISMTVIIFGVVPV